MHTGELVDAAVCQDYSRSSRLEWLDTNSAGAFAMGTVAGVRTRRYHGLLNTPQPGASNFVWLSCLEESLKLGEETIELAVQQYGNLVSPEGFRYLAEFRPSPFPSWLYRIGESSLRREFFLVEGRPLAVVRYCCSDDAELEIRPLLAARDYHSLRRAHEIDWRVVEAQDYVALHTALGTIHIRSDAAAFAPKPDWYYRFAYREEQERGLDAEEDLWTPGVLRFALRADTWSYLVFGLEDPGPLDALSVIRWAEAKESRFPVAKSPVARLRNSARHYLFRRGETLTVQAGFPWFTDWGRDTFIALPGLLLVEPDVSAAAEVIEGFLSRRRDGLIPNRILEDGQTAEYNSIDATLWLFIAVAHWLRAGGDRRRFEDRFYQPLREMLDTLARGTIYNIAADPADGLLQAGTPDTQLTWMDARVDGVAVTPRYGKAVEINCLWYNALRLMTEWSRSRGDYPAELRFGAMANRTISGFTEHFWNPQAGCLYDCLRPGFADPSIRPNQIFALSLPYPLVVRTKAESLLRVVDRELLTLYGLRTLAPSQPGFAPVYRGGPRERDRSYHQGTVWPWLFGPYLRARLRVYGATAEEKAHGRTLLEPLLEQLDAGCLGHLPEIYDGFQPRTGKGAPAQAWSVAEILSLLTHELSS